MKGRNFVMIPLFVITVIACITYGIEVKAFNYDWNEVSTDCDCNTATVGTLTSEDWSQDPNDQNTAWTQFKNDHPGLVDSDRLGNRTATYNCHSYVYRGSSGWVNTITGYHGDNSGCWKAVSSGGTIFSDSSHSCLITNNQGKTGSMFLCKNNQYIYNPMPTQRYEKQ